MQDEATGAEGDSIDNSLVYLFHSPIPQEGKTEDFLAFFPFLLPLLSFIRWKLAMERLQMI